MTEQRTINIGRGIPIKPDLPNALYVPKKGDELDLDNAPSVDLDGTWLVIHCEPDGLNHVVTLEPVRGDNS